MLNDELDVLECRLTELQDEDVTHVLVEATLNHQGRPKPLHYQENRDRFARWNDRIIHVTVDDLDPGDTGAWGRENAQREATCRGLADADPGDVIIHSDCDEILAPHAIRAAREMTGPGLKFRLRHFIFACDWEIIGGELWDKPAATRLGNVTSFTDLRRNNNFPALPGDAGWHLSFFGGPDGIRRKMQADCHPEVRAAVIRYADDGLSWEKGLFPFDIGHAEPVDPDETWPRFIREGRAPAVWFRPRYAETEAIQ